ncbi:23S rRNA (guanosine(2251)-2'-O)-methyltransferase RlmB [Thermovibrio ammonificans]|uniref:RNA methyltransferase, TrmH family, group 3 n=1 Tax=Thermovibrio ammonificans (strain DSM 15698 / JCM 12110 / HB-1) TaxID=648996 RepID=E8T2H1_THEA1|nr:23S rRNA (guanosine(2251)-2'-O)-methyltransferase RlmB [Thermovibrio ammonificans]ADU97066.1 RNA methyltransferase, TrmH family, group 3 [Thermovibrio ammonificans HB-1]
MVIYGVNPVAEALRAGYPIMKIFVEKNFKDREKVLETARQAGIKVVKTTKQKLTELAKTTKHQGIVALVSPVEPKPFEELAQKAVEENGYLLFLDRIEDPHNLGAIFRSADAFKVTGIVIPRDRSVTVTETVAKTSTGALFYVPFAVVNSFVTALREFKEMGGWLVGLEAGGKPLSKFEFPFPLGLVAGSEGRGLSRSTVKQLDELVEIEMGGHVNSLNVSNAVAIGLYKVFCQRYINS